MTLTLLNIDNQHQIIVSIIFNNITREIRVTTESTNDEQITAFICTPGSSHYSFIEALIKNPPPSADQGSRREVLDDNYFSQYKRQNLYYQKPNLQHYK